MDAAPPGIMNRCRGPTISADVPTAAPVQTGRAGRPLFSSNIANIEDFRRESTPDESVNRAILPISLRFLARGRSISLLRFLSGISIVGVTLGTALLIVVLSIFNGFYEVVQSLLKVNDPDLRIESVDGRPFTTRSANLEGIRQSQHVVDVSELVEGRALLVDARGRNEGVLVKGHPPGGQTRINRLDAHLVEGTLDVGVQAARPGIVIPLDVANRLGIGIGDRVALLSAHGMRTSLTSLSGPGLRAFEVRGLLSREDISGETIVHIHIDGARRVFGLGPDVDAIEVSLTGPELAQAEAERLSGVLPPGFRVRTWYDLRKPLYDVMSLEKWASYVILMIIILVATLNIVGSLAMIVLQKRRDIGILMTLGMTPRDIRSLFLVQGAWIGIIGSVLGGAIGLGLTVLQDRIGFLKLSSAFLIDAYPVSIHAPDVVLVLTGTFALCLLASGYPAWRASRIDPSEAVR